MSYLCTIARKINVTPKEAKLSEKLHLRGSFTKFENFFIIGPILLKFSHNMQNRKKKFVPENFSI